MHLPFNAKCVSFTYQANLAPTTHTPSRQACHPIVGRVLPLEGISGQTRLETAVWTTWEAAFAGAIMRTAELVIPPKERRRPGRGWSEDTRTETELQAATDAMHAAWQRLKMDTMNAQLRRVVRKAYNWLKRVRSAAVVRFFGRHVVELEMQLRMGDQHGFFQNH